MECKRNPKKFWHYINRKTTTKTGVRDLQWKDPNGSVVFADNDRDKATALLQFFSSVYTVEPDDEFDRLPNMNKQS